MMDNAAAVMTPVMVVIVMGGGLAMAYGCQSRGSHGDSGQYGDEPATQKGHQEKTSIKMNLYRSSLAIER
jgi:hypothetical protein